MTRYMPSHLDMAGQCRVVRCRERADGRDVAGQSTYTGSHAMWAARAAMAALLLAQAATADHQPPPLATMGRQTPRAVSLSLQQLDQSLDVLSELLEETRLPSGGVAVRSQLTAPTRFSDSATCKMHTDIFWQELQSGSLWAIGSEYLIC